MGTPGGYQGRRPRTQGREKDPLVTVSLHVRKSQLAELDQLADAARTSRAALVREAISERPWTWGDTAHTSKEML